MKRFILFVLSFVAVMSITGCGGGGSSSSSGGILPLSSIALPANPTNLAATVSNGSVYLTWTAPSQPPSPSSYTVYRENGSSSGAQPAVAIATGVTSTSYTDPAPGQGVWEYYVVAVDAAGPSVGAGGPGDSIYVTINPNGSGSSSILYQVNPQDKVVSVINRSTNAVVATIQESYYAFTVAVDSTANRIYSIDKTGNVTITDSSTNQVLSTIPVNIQTQGSTESYRATYSDGNISVTYSNSDQVLTTIPIGTSLYGITAESGTPNVYVAEVNGNSCTVYIIDTTTNSVIATAPVVNYQPV